MLIEEPAIKLKPVVRFREFPFGAATDPCDLNLGDPVWRDHGGRDAYEPRCGHPYRDR